MDNSLSYADIIQNTLQEATKYQPRIQSIQLYPVCDRDSGHFLILATGWDKQRWINTILFHAHLVVGDSLPLGAASLKENREVIIEEDNFEEGLTSALIAAGIDAKNIRTSIVKQKIASSNHRDRFDLVDRKLAKGKGSPTG